MARVITDVLMYLFESFIIWHYANTIFESRFKKSLSLVIIIACYSLAFGVYELGNPIFNFVSLLIADFVIFKFIYNISVKTAVFHSIIFLAIMAASELITMSLVSVAFRQSINELDNDLRTYLFDVIISKLFYFIVCMIFMKTFAYRENRSNVKKNYWLLLIMPLSCVIIMMVFRYVTYGTELTSGMYALWCVSTFLMLFSNIFVFYIYENSQKESEELYELKAIRQKEELDKTYFNIMEQANKDMRVFVHDIKNHFIQIRSLDSMDAVNEYIDKLYPQVEKISFIGVSKNKMLDLIISKYSTLCENKNINFKYDVKTSNLSYVENTDLSSLLNNLLDNAMESAEKSEKGQIVLDIFAKNQMCDAIVLKNSCEKEPNIKGNRLLTTKKDKELHGIGLSSVLKTLKKYNAVYDWHYDSRLKQFETTIVFPKKEICDNTVKG